MGGFRSFFIESKFFQLVVEEGGNFFSLKIFERGKYFMKSVFMGKHAAQWFMHTVEHSVIGVKPKLFFTFREGDTAYTVQQGSNQFGQYLSVTEIKVGGLRRTIIIPAGRAQQGWRVFGIELRRLLNPSQYAMGDPKFIPHRLKLSSEVHSSRTFVETLKGPVQRRDMKQAQQPILSDKATIRIAESLTKSPRDNPHMQVVVFDSQTGNSAPTAVGGVERRDRRINGEKQPEAKIPQGNRLRFPLRFNTISNSKQIASGTERDRRNYSWLRKGLIVEVKENCRRRVFWEHVTKREQKSMWVSRGTTAPVSNSVGLGPSSLKAYKLLLGNDSYVGPEILSPRVFEAGACSKTSHPGLGPSQLNCDLAVCPSSPGKQKEGSAFCDDSRVF